MSKDEAINRMNNTDLRETSRYLLDIKNSIFFLSYHKKLLVTTLITKKKLGKTARKSTKSLPSKCYEKNCKNKYELNIENYLMKKKIEKENMEDIDTKISQKKINKK